MVLKNLDINIDMNWVILKKLRESICMSNIFIFLLLFV